jgi:hypothetical protein
LDFFQILKGDKSISARAIEFGIIDADFDRFARG